MYTYVYLHYVLNYVKWHFDLRRLSSDVSGAQNPAGK